MEKIFSILFYILVIYLQSWAYYSWRIRIHGPNIPLCEFRSRVGSGNALYEDRIHIVGYVRTFEDNKTMGHHSVGNLGNWIHYW